MSDPAHKAETWYVVNMHGKVIRTFTGGDSAGDSRRWIQRSGWNYPGCRTTRKAPGEEKA